MLSSIWAWAIRTSRISNFEGCSGAAASGRSALGSDTCQNRAHLRRCAPVPLPLSPSCHLALFQCHVTNGGTRITLATHVSAHTRSTSATCCSVWSLEGCGGGPRSRNCYSSNTVEAVLLRLWHKFIFYCGCAGSVNIMRKTNLKETAESPVKMNFTNFIY